MARQAFALIVALGLFGNAEPNRPLGNQENRKKGIIDQGLPDELDWSNVDGKNFLSIMRNQHRPQYCQAAWVFATLSTVADRFKVMNNAAWPDINLSPQVLLSCDYADQGCFGGSVDSALDYIYKNGITDETCQTYQARGWSNGLNCSSTFPCYTCEIGLGCYVPATYLLYNITGYTKISGESEIISSLQDGLVICSIEATESFQSYSSGIYFEISNSASLELNHSVSVIGYGSSNGTAFWIARNSWGSSWGEGGLFRIVRGENALGIEQDCTVPFPDPNIRRVSGNSSKIEEYSKSEKNSEKSRNEFLAPVSPASEPSKYRATCRSPKTKVKDHELLKGPRAHEVVKEVPAAWDWRNVSGVN
jgi:cathepsin X